MKMFEYIACGRAILSSDLPVLHEVLNEKNAIFCQPEDVESWARALQLLLDDPGLRERLGQQAAQDVISYSWKARAEKALRSLVETRFG
jgi:glycosyltransferase involved in cell wall biosynthesis